MTFIHTDILYAISTKNYVILRYTFQLSNQIIVPIPVHKLSQNLNVKSLYVLKFHIYVYSHGVT